MANTPKDPLVMVCHPGSTLCLNASNHASIGPEGLQIGDTPVPMLQSVVDALRCGGLVVLGPAPSPAPSVQE